MKILIASYHNPNFINTSVYRDKAVEYMGYELVSFDDRRFIFPGRLRKLFTAVHAWDLERLNSQLVKKVRETKPDLVIAVGGHRVLPGTVKAIRDLGICIVLWTTDAPVDFKNILAAAPYYDHLFCAGSEACDIFENEGSKNVSWVPFACDPAFHRPVELTQEDKKRYGRDIAFVGSYYSNRAKLLGSIADLDIGIWGPHWNKADIIPGLIKKTRNTKLNFDQWVRIYCAAKITLVIHYQDPAVPCYQASPKLFEAMACGAFVLVDRQKDAQRIFKDGQHVVFFDQENDLREKIAYYLSHPDERRKIAQQGCRFVRESHRYQDRIKQMIVIMRSSGRLRS